MYGIYVHTHTHTHSQYIYTHSPAPGSQKQIYEAIKAHLSETVTNTHTQTHAHITTNRQVQSFAYPSPPSTHWRQMFSVILHLFSATHNSWRNTGTRAHTHTHTRTHTHTHIYAHTNAHKKPPSIEKDTNTFSHWNEGRLLSPRLYNRS